MKYNFSEVEVKDITGKTLDIKVGEALGNALYISTKDLGMVESAMKIYRGEDVELDKTEIEEVKRVVQDEKTGFFSFVQKAMLDYIESKKS